MILILSPANSIAEEIENNEDVAFFIDYDNDLIMTCPEIVDELEKALDDLIYEEKLNNLDEYGYNVYFDFDNKDYKREKLIEVIDNNIERLLKKHKPQLKSL